MTPSQTGVAERSGGLDARVAALLTHAPVIIFTLNRRGIFTFSAGKGLRALGRVTGEVVGRSAFDVYEDVPWILRAVRRALNGEVVAVTGEVNGAWFEVHYVPLRREEGDLDGVVGFAIDITARRRADQELERSQQRYRELIDSIDGIVWEVDVATFRFTFVSRQAERILGYTIDEWMEPDFWVSHLHPDDRNWAPAFCQNAAAEKRAHEFDYRMIAADGRDVWLRDIVSVVEHDGRLTLSGVMVDITPLKAAEDERCRLLEKERAARTAAVTAEEQSRLLASRMRALADVSLAFAEAGVDFASIADVVVRQVGFQMGDGCALRLVSPDGRQLDHVASFHPNEARRAALRQAFAASCQRVDEGVTAQVLRTGEPLMLRDVTPAMVHARMKVEYWAYLDDVCSVLAAPIVSRGRVNGVLTLLRDRPGLPYTPDDRTFLQDLAARAALALEVGRSFQEAQEAIRARDEFLSVASHELRTPLAAATLQLQVLRRIESAPQQLTTMLPRGLAAVDEQLGRLNRLTDDLLDVSKLRLGQLELHREEFELVELVREVVTRHQRALKRSRSTVDIQGDSGVVGEWDRLRMEQVVSSLLSNAIKFGQGKPIEVLVTSDGVHAHLVVTDHGMGVPLHLQSRIFDRFERAVSLRHYGGLGLGLYVVRRIVEAHGGAISLESTPGQGARFSVVLPLRAPDALPAAQ